MYRVLTKKMNSTLGVEVSYNTKPLTVVITGGVGSFGQALTELLLGDPSVGIIRIFSRDEFKQSEMQKKFTSPKLRYFIGDVRDVTRLSSAFYQADVVIHAAAMKQVPACEYNPQEAIKTNILGTENVINACIEQKVGKALFISTDKAVDPVNLYGATKLVAEKVWLNANNVHKTKFSLTRWGNVLSSRGSVIPLFEEQAKTGTITVTDERMTRFILTLQEAVMFAWSKVKEMGGGEVFIPELQSARIMDIATAIAPDALIEFTGIRQGEKLHESLGDGYVSNDPKRLLSLDKLEERLWSLRTK